MEATAEREYLSVQVKNYRMFKKNSERQLLEQGVTLIAMTFSLKQLEEQSASLENEKIVLVNINEDLLRIYSEQKTVGEEVWESW